MAKNFVGISVNVDTTQIDRLSRDVNNKVQKVPMKKVLDWITKRMKTYPPVRPSSKYVRTGDHRKGVVRLQRSKNSASVIFTDRYNRKGRPYAQWVRDTRLQAGVHRGRWPTSDDIAREAEQKAKGFYEYEIERLK